VWVFRPGALGDALLAVPALRALRAALPDVHLTFVANASAARLLVAAGEADRGLPFDHPDCAWLFGSPLPAGEPRPDAVVAWLSDSEGTLATYLRSVVAGPSIVWNSRPLEESGIHCADHLLQAVEALVGRPQSRDDRPIRLDPTPPDTAQAVAKPAPPDSASLTATGHVVLVHPGSGSPRKNWPASHFARVASRLQAAGLGIELIVGEADAAPVAALERSIAGTPTRHSSESLEILARHLAGSLAYLGNDSGISHLAGLVGARTFTLFGPTQPAIWRPLGPRVTVVPFDTAPERVAELILAALDDSVARL
jgi:ADP-heptose:LPS heptosyltransferase